jgi:LysM repeat protein
VQSKGLQVLCGLAVVALGVGLANAQETRKAAPAPGVTAKVGPATIAPHWSKYKYPESVPEGAPYHIVEKGDTLWDLSRTYLGNPYLWPQIWDQNRYVSDAHWIYPGDPLLLPQVALISPQAGQPGGEGEEGEAGLGEGVGGAGGSGGAVLYPLSEEATMQCAMYIVSEHEDSSLQVLGSEQGSTKVSLSTYDILYLNKGSNAGVKEGDVYSLHHVAYSVKHPVTGKNIGTKIDTTGWARIILVQENTSTAVVDEACNDIHAGDYLKPLEKANVPLSLRRDVSTRLTPPTGKTGAYVVDIANDAMIAAAGNLVSIDVGSDAGIAPGNIFSIYRIMYPSVPTSRNVIGELAVLTVRDKTAVAKVTYSRDAIMPGDQVELR